MRFRMVTVPYPILVVLAAADLRSLELAASCPPIISCLPAVQRAMYHKRGRPNMTVRVLSQVAPPLLAGWLRSDAVPVDTGGCVRQKEYRAHLLLVHRQSFDVPMIDEEPRIARHLVSPQARDLLRKKGADVILV